MLSTWLAPPCLTSTQQGLSPAGYPLTIYTLQNGHRILVERRGGGIVGVRTFVNAGSVWEDAVKPGPPYRDLGLPSGIAHLDEHCHFLTTRHFPTKNAWAQTVARYGANANASTDNEVIQHELFFNREDAPTLLALHAESLLHPVYNAGDIPQEKAAVLNEVALRSRQPDFQLESKLDELLFNRPATQTGGRPADVATTGAEQLRLFYRMAYTPDRMVTVVSGDVDPASALAILGPAFGNNPNRADLPVNPALAMVLKPGERRSAVIHNVEWSNSKVMLGFPAPASNHFRDRIAMEFLTEALDGGLLSPLPLRLIVQSRLAFREAMGYEPLNRTGVTRIRLDCAPGRERDVLAATLGVLSDIGAHPPDARTVEGIRDRLVTRFRQGQDTVAEVTGRLGGETLSDTLPYYLYYEQLAKTVTGEDIARVARTYLNPQCYAVVFGLPAGSGGVKPAGGATLFKSRVKSRGAAS
jgi:predicted Zn-dependent peptidase